MRAAFGAASVLALVACTGGAGALPGSFTTQDPAPTSQDSVAKTGESSPSTQEPVARTNEAPPTGDDAVTSPQSSAADAGTFSCHGTYHCTLGGVTYATTVVNGSPGDCLFQGYTVNTDNTISQDGKVVSAWTGDDSDFMYAYTDPTTGTNSAITCTKINDDATGAH